MADIVLTTQNARYIHPALGLRSLLANLGPLRDRAVLREHTLQDRPSDLAEALLAERPRVVGIGVYVWNAAPALRLVRVLRRVAPEVRVVVGGPEVSHEIDAQELTRLADVVIAGEAEVTFRETCERLLAGAPVEHVVRSEPPDPSRLELPYALYDDDDVTHRVAYVETSRGCPYGCRFCLSALDRRVRRFPLERVLDALDTLVSRGVRHFKFVDRSLHLGHGHAVLEWLLRQKDRGVFAHFELVPDRLPEALLPLLGRFAPGTLQLEVGVQTFDPHVAARVGRAQDGARVAETLTRLRATAAHVHADLVVGLPGESLAGFGEGFDRLMALGPAEIQVGILKRLRGAPLAADADALGLVFDPEPPYEVLRTDALDFPTVQRLRRFSQAWDRVANSGRFPTAAPMIWADDAPFAAFLRFSDWLTRRAGRTHSISFKRLADLLHAYLTTERGLDPDVVGPRLLADYRRSGARDRPGSLRDLPEPPPGAAPGAAPLPRQRRHLS